MKCVIMQPTYLPWAGYFNLISQADYFVFLDDVQFEKSSWQNRNRILLNGRAHWLTVSTKRESLSQKINTITFDETRNWRKKNFLTVQNAYNKHQYGKDVLNVLEVILDESISYLSDLNIHIIMSFCKKMGLNSNAFRSGELNISGKRTERLLSLCKHFSCDEYLSPVGSADYLQKDGFSEDAFVNLLFQDYRPDVYEQKDVIEFIPYLSIVDVVANIGWERARDYIRS